ncbi:MAG: glycosyltransferase family 39 protein [Acidobacteriota bacterium]|nr:glycosyltransferase family 39 protein [Acidobacteriota bacterium]
MRGRLLPYLVLAAAATAVLLPGIGSRDLWNPDEPRYAEVAREMLLEPRAIENFLVPRLNGERYDHKPPLHFWNIALFGALRGGVDEVAARLPSLLAGIGSVLVVFALAGRMFDRRTAWLAAPIFLTSALVMWNGRVGQIDMTLTSLELLAILFWARGRSWAADDPPVRPGGHLANLPFFACLGLATLAKGPVGLIVPLLAVVTWLAIERDRAGVAELRLGRGLLLWAAIVLAWFGPAVWIAGKSYFDALILDQTVSRYAEATYHPRPWHYYFRTLPGTFAPWTLLAPVTVYAAFRASHRESAGREARAVRFLLIWIASTFVFFSVSGGKRTVYLLALAAPLAMLVAYGVLAIRDRWPRYRTAFLISAATVPLLFGVVAAAAPVAARDLPEGSIPDGTIAWLQAVAAIPVLAGLIGLYLAARRRPDLLVACLATGLGLTMLVTAVRLLPLGDAFKSARALSDDLVRWAEPDEPYAIYPVPDAAFLFYTRRFAVDLHGGILAHDQGDEEALRRFVARTDRPVWLLVERDNLERLSPPLDLVEVARDRDPEQGHVLLTTPEAAARVAAAEGSER